MSDKTQIMVTEEIDRKGNKHLTVTSGRTERIVELEKQAKEAFNALQADCDKFREAHPMKAKNDALLAELSQEYSKELGAPWVASFFRGKTQLARPDLKAAQSAKPAVALTPEFTTAFYAPKAR